MPFNKFVSIALKEHFFTRVPPCPIPQYLNDGFSKTGDRDKSPVDDTCHITSLLSLSYMYFSLGDLSLDIDV